MSTSDPIHIQQSDSDAQADYRADGLVIENGGNIRFQAGLSILSNEVSSGNIFFGDRLNPKAGQVKYNHYLDKFFFYTNGIHRADIGTDGLNVNGQVTCTNFLCSGITTFSDDVDFTSTVTFDNNSTSEPNITLDVPSSTVKKIIDVTENDTNKGGICYYYGQYGQSPLLALVNEYHGLRIKSYSANQHSLEPSTAGGLAKDDAVDLGTSSNKFDDIYATNGTIQTSDRNEKQNIEELSEAEGRVAVAAKGLLRKFKWRSAVENKGDNARVHFGIIAQDLQEAFEAEGLDASDYGMFTSATWWEHEGESYVSEEDAPEGATQKTRMGVRYSELLAFIIAGI
jgi:hypothetical protein